MILAVETSCDDTSVALVDKTGALFFHRSLSQNDLHAPYGGVVPELASRTHSERLPLLVGSAFRETGTTPGDLEAAALTVGPGLSGGLLSGIAYLKGLCYPRRIPIIPVNHIQAHLRVAVTRVGDILPGSMGLVVSGGHTHLYRISRWPDLDLVGQTMDDAAGEAFDKGAKALGLPYPGGPQIELMASMHRGSTRRFVKRIQTRLEFDFSFSGLKTAFVQKIRQEGMPSPQTVPEYAASYQEEILDHLTDRIGRALRHFRPTAFLVGGGVAANGALRVALQTLCRAEGIPLHLTPAPLCGDNAVMVALTGLELFLSGQMEHPPYGAIRPRPKWDHC